jgi:hypothetical protein
MNKPKYLTPIRQSYIDNLANDPDNLTPITVNKQVKYCEWENNNIYWKTKVIPTQITINDGLGSSRKLTKLEYKFEWLKSEWIKFDAIENRYAYEFEYKCRHHPLLISKSGFGGIAHELYTSNRPVFYIHSLGLSADLKPIAIVSHANNKSHIDLSPLFIGMSANKRKRILKYNKIDKTFSDQVYNFVAKVINSTMVTKF